MGRTTTKTKVLGGRQHTIIMSYCLVDAQVEGEHAAQKLKK